MAERVPQNEQVAQPQVGAGMQAAGVGGGLPGGDLGQLGERIGQQIDGTFKALAEMDDFGLQQQAEYNLRAMQVTAGQEIQRRMALPDGDEESLFEADGRLRQTAVRDLVNSYTADIEEIGRLPISAQRRAAVQGKAAQTALGMLDSLMTAGFKAQQQKVMDNFQNNYQLALTQEDYSGANTAVQDAVASGLISASKGRLLMAQTAKRGAHSRLGRAISEDAIKAAQMLNNGEFNPWISQSEEKQARKQMSGAACTQVFAAIRDESTMQFDALDTEGDVLTEDHQDVGDELTTQFGALDAPSPTAEAKLGRIGRETEEDGKKASGSGSGKKKTEVTDYPVMTVHNGTLYTELSKDPTNATLYHQLEAHVMARAGAFNPLADLELEKGDYLAEFRPFVDAGLISLERLNAIWAKVQKDTGELKIPTIDIKTPVDRLEEQDSLFNSVRWNTTKGEIEGDLYDLLPGRNDATGKYVEGGKVWSKYRNVAGVMQMSDLLKFLNEKGELVFDEDKGRGEADLKRMLLKTREAIRRHLFTLEKTQTRSDIESQWNAWRFSPSGKNASAPEQAEELRAIIKRVTGNSSISIDVAFDNENAYKQSLIAQEKRRDEYYADEGNKEQVKIQPKAKPAPPSWLIVHGAQARLANENAGLAVNEIRVPKEYNLGMGSTVLLTLPGLKNVAMYATVVDNTAQQLEFSPQQSAFLQIGPGEDITVNLKEVSRGEAVYGTNVARDTSRKKLREIVEKEKKKKQKAGKR
ncbi:MAG: hypothetical protein LUE08_00045 [Akkermansiaceae bacterium]|nr:hypothetical protein [Akkermansiaceae bacterium]